MERSEKLLSREQSVLAIVDLQDTLLKAIKVGTQIAENIALLVRVAHNLQIPILATTQNASKLGGIAPVLAMELEQLPVVDKLCFSCVGSEDFMRELQKTGRTQVLITGIEAHICIMQTALDLLKAGYTVHVPYDAVASRQKRDWKYALLRMAHSGVIVTSVESAIYEWLYEAGTEQFRSVLPLLKAREEQRLKAEEEEEEDEPEGKSASGEENHHEQEAQTSTSERDSEE
ncbi:MAG: isochorismatase family protein [Armatimonadetes bacterium]|nr:MAG: isochorismatase family protein [Armatimonadota bacterium]